MTWKQGFDHQAYYDAQTDLQKHMGHQLGKCPLHGGVGLTFQVDGPEFVCLVCGAHGDALAFEMAKTNASQEEAAQALSDWQSARNRAAAEKIRNERRAKDGKYRD